MRLHRSSARRQAKALAERLAQMTRGPLVLDFSVADLHQREMDPSERSLVVACWWAMRREGVRLPAERGVIVIDGGA